jgi:1-acyl-sn-glycerol-3-phosphate acyltransferase
MYNIGLDFFLFMGKYELLKWPLVGMFFKRMNIAVNRGSRTEAAKALLRAGRSIDKGICVSLFPEGTIPYTVPRMKHFKDGAFKLAIEKQVPIVPITFLDHWRLFGDPADLMSRGRPGLARVIRHPYIETKGMTEADLDGLRHRVFDVIEGPLVDAFGAKSDM